MVLTFQSASSTRFLVPLDLQSVFWRTEKLPKDIVSVQGFAQSIGGKEPVLQKSANGAVAGKGSRLKRVEVRFKFKGLAVLRESTVTLSGSVPWEMIYRVLVRLVPEVKQLTFTTTNTAVRFYLKKQVRIDEIGRSGKKVVGARITYEPELYFSRLVMKFTDGIVASVFANGTVVAQGKDLTGIEARVRGVLAQYPGAYGANVTKSPVAARKNLAKKRADMIAGRYDLAKNWTNTRNGFYVRPGPDKAPRFYKVPANPALVRQKVLKAYANVGVNVPLRVRAALGIVNTTVKKSAAPRKDTASNWNMSPPTGMYIRPGPGGLPKLYKIPKLIPQGRKTVLEAYKKAGVRIPNKVRAVFGIPASAAVRGASVSPVRSAGPKVSPGGRINGLDCMRYKVADLRRIAARLDVPLSGRMKKDEICRALKKQKAAAVTVPLGSPNFVKNGVPYYVLSNERKIKRNKHVKSMNSFKVAELKNMILALNSSENVSGKISKKNLINKLVERKRTKGLFNNMNFNFSPSSSEASSSASSSEARSAPSRASSSALSTPRRDPMNIARNLLGNNFSNTELRNFLNRYLKLKNPESELNKLVNEFKRRKHSPATSRPVLRRLKSNVNVERM